MIEHIKDEWWFKEYRLSDGSYIDRHGDVGYVKSGKLHRDDGPAIERVNGNKFWYKNGKRHREDGPAVEYYYGKMEWWVDDEECTEEDYKDAVFAYKINRLFQ